MAAHAGLDHAPISGQPNGLYGQGFLAPDFNLVHLQQILGRLNLVAGQAQEAMEHASEALDSVQTAGEQSMRHADRVMRLPSNAYGGVPMKAYGDAEGYAPVRSTWGDKPEKTTTLACGPELAYLGMGIERDRRILLERCRKRRGLHTRTSCFL
mmetsp:Transcript_93198/g.164869  ORF Transcript_93198/g.164869 Transcript_93198/m.164869 type:complete len:154 (-) Transcript_93198:117-578(-)